MCALTPPAPPPEDEELEDELEELEDELEELEELEDELEEPPPATGVPPDEPPPPPQPASRNRRQEKKQERVLIRICHPVRRWMSAEKTGRLKTLHASPWQCSSTAVSVCGRRQVAAWLGVACCCCNRTQHCSGHATGYVTGLSFRASTRPVKRSGEHEPG
jgi:hypothetical protein